VDRREVTRSQFDRFVSETGFVVRGGALPSSTVVAPGVGIVASADDWKTLDSGNPRRGELPVVAIGLADARRYAAWAGARLLRAEEFREVARSSLGGRAGPWVKGSGLQSNLADQSFLERYSLSEWRETGVGQYLDGHASAAPVGSFPADENGLFDVYGNAEEICEGRDADELGVRILCTVCGGSWISVPTELERRLCREVKTGDDPEWRGFRCAVDLRPEGK
jgi:formylglycine-generating enzyme required for sulfatase activity